MYTFLNPSRGRSFANVAAPNPHKYPKDKERTAHYWNSVFLSAQHEAEHLEPTEPQGEHIDQHGHQEVAVERLFNIYDTTTSQCALAI
jgi:hypothetical protein